MVVRDCSDWNVSPWSRKSVNKFQQFLIDLWRFSATGKLYDRINRNIIERETRGKSEFMP